MKKKLLLMIFATSLFILAFAMCIGATTIYRDSEGNELFRFEADENSIITTYEGSFPKTNSSGDALTWYVTATSTENGNTIKTVASVLTLDENYATLNNGTYSYKTSTVNTKTVVSVYFPSDKGITTLNLANEGYKNNINWDPSGTEILFVYLPSTLTTLPNRIVQGSKALVCEMPSDMPIETISRVSFYEAKCLREINIPSSVTLIDGVNKNDGAAFYYCVSLEKVTFGANSQLETIGTMAFNNCNSLKYIKLPDGVKKIGQHALSYTDLRESPFGAGSLCEELGGRCFGNIPDLESFIVPATIKKAEILGDNDWGPLAETNVGLVTFGNSAPITELVPVFFGRAIIDRIILPEGPTNIPNRYFVNATLTDVCFSSTIETAEERVFQGSTIEVIRLGANFKHFTNTAIDHQSFTNALKGLKEIYIPASFYASAPSTMYQSSYAFDCGSSNNIKFFYTGTSEQLAIAIDNFKNQTTVSGTNNWKFVGATPVSYEDYIGNTEAYANGNYIVYGYDSCEAFCVPFYTEDMSFDTTISYKSYLEKGTKAVACPVCGTLGEGVEVDPLFVCLGYSSPENGDGGISIRYTVNATAIEEYTKATGKSLSYGMFATTKQAIGNSDIFDGEGNAVNGAIALDVTKSNFAFIALKMVGFETEESKKAEFAIGAYVVTTKDEQKSYSYLQQGTPVNGEKYAYIKYNDFVSTNS